VNYVYLLRCGDGTLYCGWTTDLDARLKAHNSGKGAKYTRSRLPVELVYREIFESKEEAMSREWHRKRMTRQEKLRLIAGSKEEEHGAKAREAQRDLHGL
jgi:putative endonuclease